MANFLNTHPVLGALFVTFLMLMIILFTFGMIEGTIQNFVKRTISQIRYLRGEIPACFYCQYWESIRQNKGVCKYYTWGRQVENAKFNGCVNFKRIVQDIEVYVEND